MAMLLAARFRWCRANLYDAYFNNVMAWLMLALLLRERVVEDLLSRTGLMTVTTAQQLPCVAMVFACDSIVALSFSLIMVLVVLARFTWMFTSELRQATEIRELLLAVVGILFAVVIAAACVEAPVLAVTDQLGWTHTVEFRLRFHGSQFLWPAVVIYLLGAVPLAVRLHSYLGLDRMSRTWKRLQPLACAATGHATLTDWNEHGRAGLTPVSAALTPYPRGG